MKTTIGEVADMVLPFSNVISMSYKNDMPYLIAYIKSFTGITRVHFYVAQTKEHVYSACSSSSYNNRLIVTGNPSKPFIDEKSSVITDLESTDITTHNLGYNDIKNYFLNILWSNDIIRFDPKSKGMLMSGMGFNNVKIRRIIDQSFVASKHHGKTIGDLLDIVMDEEKHFDLNPLKERDLRCVNAKLRDIGLIPVISNGYITKIDFERRKL